MSNSGAYENVRTVIWAYRQCARPLACLRDTQVCSHEVELPEGLVQYQLPTQPGPNPFYHVCSCGTGLFLTEILRPEPLMAGNEHALGTGTHLPPVGKLGEQLAELDQRDFVAPVPAAELFERNALSHRVGRLALGQ